MESVFKVGDLVVYVTQGETPCGLNELFVVTQVLKVNEVAYTEFKTFFLQCVGTEEYLLISYFLEKIKHASEQNLSGLTRLQKELICYKP